MEEKKVKISLTGLIFFILLIAVIVGGLVYFFTNYDLQIMSKNEKQEIIETEKEELEDIEESKVEELDKDSELVKELYSIVLKYNKIEKDNREYSAYSTVNSFYKDDKITYSKLLDSEKVLAILNATKKEDYKQNIELDNIGLKEYNKIFGKWKEEWNDKNIIYGNAYLNIEKTLKRIFGENSKIENKSYTLLAGNLEYNNDTYYIYDIDGGGMGDPEYGYSEIQKVEKEDEKIYIYDKYIYMNFANVWMQEENNEFVYFYTSADKTKEIGKEKDDFKFYDRINQRSYTDEEIFSSVYKKYEDKLNTYKHTFQKAEDGTYYWVSSEIYKFSEENEKLKLGNFSTDKIFDPGYGEGIVNINLKENKQFEINGSYGGTTYTGIYEIVNNKLICSASKKTLEEGGYNEKNVEDVFEFEIISETELNFEKCKNDSKLFELSKNIKYINSVNNEIKLSELVSVNSSNNDEINNFIKNYYNQKVKITGYISVYGQADVGFSVGIGDSKTYNLKTMAGGIINDSEMIEKVKKLKQGDKISIIGTVKEYCWPISLEDATVVIEK